MFKDLSARLSIPTGNILFDQSAKNLITKYLKYRVSVNAGFPVKRCSQLVQNLSRAHVVLMGRFKVSSFDVMSSIFLVELCHVTNVFNLSQNMFYCSDVDGFKEVMISCQELLLGLNV